MGIELDTQAARPAATSAGAGFDPATAPGSGRIADGPVRRSARRYRSRDHAASDRTRLDPAVDRPVDLRGVVVAEVNQPRGDGCARWPTASIPALQSRYHRGRRCGGSGRVRAPSGTGLADDHACLDHVARRDLAWPAATGRRHGDTGEGAAHRHGPVRLRPDVRRRRSARGRGRWAERQRRHPGGLPIWVLQELVTAGFPRRNRSRSSAR